MVIIGGLIHMKNENSLIALAYIKENDNPLVVFCNYILVCLYETHNHQLRHDEVSEKIAEIFGLQMPHHMVKMCCKMLENEKKIVRLPQGAGYELKDFSFDLKAFEARKSDLKGKERLLINGLLTYAEDYNQNWSDAQARDYLTNFLVDRGNAVAIFSENPIETIEKDKHVPPQWYVGKYISYLLDNNDERTEYLLDIVNGLMIYLGVYETQDYYQDRNQKFKGTDFYFDTKLLLRLMGYSWNLESESSKELSDIIKNEYGGNICVFEHTVGEIEWALNNAAESLKRGDLIGDYELRLYAELNKCNEYDFKLHSQSVRNMIEKTLKLRIQPTIDWENAENYRNHLDWEEIKKFLKKRHPSWKERAVENDVDTINYINILRKGDYSIKYGGKKKLPVFITSNTVLVKDIKEYISQYRDDDKGVASWNLGALPIITDNMLICRLWLPKAKSLSSIPVMTLARNAYAAQQVNHTFFDKLKASAKDLKNKHNIDVIDISFAKKEKLEEVLVKNTAGDMEAISTEMLATSVDELIVLETMDLQSSVKALEEKNNSQTLLLQKSKENAIRAATQRYKNKLGIKQLLVYFANSFWIIIAIVFGVLSLSLSRIKGASFFNQFSYFGLVYILLFIGLKVLEKALNRPSVNKFLLAKAVKSIWESYSHNIKKTLLDFEKDWERDILLACIEENSLLSKYQEFIKIS